MFTDGTNVTGHYFGREFVGRVVAHRPTHWPYYQITVALDEPIDMGTRGRTDIRDTILAQVTADGENCEPAYVVVDVLSAKV